MGQNEISMEFELQWKKRLWNGPLNDMEDTTPLTKHNEFCLYFMEYSMYGDLLQCRVLGNQCVRQQLQEGILATVSDKNTANSIYNTPISKMPQTQVVGSDYPLIAAVKNHFQGNLEYDVQYMEMLQDLVLGNIYSNYILLFKLLISVYWLRTICTLSICTLYWEPSVHFLSLQASHYIIRDMLQQY